MHHTSHILVHSNFPNIMHVATKGGDIKEIFCFNMDA